MRKVPKSTRSPVIAVLGAVLRSRDHGLPFWDDLILESAPKESADRPLTEDLQHGQEIAGGTMGTRYSSG